MMANGSFWSAHLGIHDTKLTEALDVGNFELAEKYILENTDPSYLNDGPYENTPLSLVLSRDEDSIIPCNLKIARMLIQNGANPNLRPLQMNFGSPACSPVENLVTLYARLRDVCNNVPMLVDDEKNPLDTIGVDGEKYLNCLELKEQVFDLLDVFLGAGGDPNGSTTLANSSVFQMAICYTDPDMELLKKLVEAGATLNNCNVHRTTPLMDLAISLDDEIATDALKYLLDKFSDIKLEDRNCSRETILWRSMYSGNTMFSIELLAQGANPTCIAKVHNCSHSIISRLFRSLEVVPCFCAPLLRDSRFYETFSSVRILTTKLQSPDISFDKDLMDKVVSCTISPYVDKLCLNTNVVAETVCDVFKKMTNFKDTIAKCDKLCVLPLTFGNTAAGLQQLCIRRIFHQLYFVADTPILKSNEANLNVDKPFITLSMQEWKIIGLTPEDAAHATQLLGLPQKLEIRFALEAARIQLGHCIYLHNSVECDSHCEDMDRWSTDESDFSANFRGFFDEIDYYSENSDDTYSSADCDDYFHEDGDDVSSDIAIIDLENKSSDASNGSSEPCMEDESCTNNKDSCTKSDENNIESVPSDIERIEYESLEEDSELMSHESEGF